MFGSIQICRVFGIPIRVHITLLLALPLFASNLSPAGGHTSSFLGLLAAIGLFASVALHELGHSVVAMAKGYRVRDITLWPIGGVAMLTQMPTKPMDEFLIAIAGPLASLVLGVACIALGSAIAATSFNGVAYMVTFVGTMNIVLFLFNLIPAFPMDGGRVLRAALTVKYGRLDATRRAAGLGRFLAVVFGIYSLLNGEFMQAVLALFIYTAAGSEYRMVQLQQAQRWNPTFDFFGRSARVPDEVDVTVSPPPYER